MAHVVESFVAKGSSRRALLALPFLRFLRVEDFRNEKDMKEKYF